VCIDLHFYARADPEGVARGECRRLGPRRRRRRGRVPKARVDSSAVGARIDAPKAPRGWCIKGGSLSTGGGFWGGGCAPPSLSSKFVFDFELKKASFAAFWD